MLLNIDFDSETPIYVQIKNEVIKGIAQGSIIPGEILPPVRQLASDIGINMHTVNKAYNLLKKENYLVIDRRRGAKILPFKSTPDREFMDSLSENLQLMIASGKINSLEKEDFYKIIDDIYSSYET